MAASAPNPANMRLIAARAAMRGLCVVAPPAAARWAETLFRTPPRHRATDAERDILAKGRRGEVRRGTLRVPTWTWGEGPVVLLVHGWGSRGGRLGSFVLPLAERGFSTLAFDAPGHGDAGGRLSSLPEFIASIEAVAESAGPVEAIVAHSMGGAASVLAIARGLSVQRAVFLAPAANPAAFSRQFAEVLGVSAAVLRAMQRRLERRFGYRWEDFDAPRAATSLTAPLLVFHDREDGEVPWSNGAAIAAAWPGARLVTTKGLGHRRIVHDPDVIRQAIDFFPARSARHVADGTSPPAEGDAVRIPLARGR